MSIQNSPEFKPENFSLHRPDIVLLDLLMPEMDGIEALQGLMDLDSGARVVVISSLGYDELVQKALALGAKQFVPKPVSFGHAANIIREVLEERPGYDV